MHISICIYTRLVDTQLSKKNNIVQINTNKSLACINLRKPLSKQKIVSVSNIKDKTLIKEYL